MDGDRDGALMLRVRSGDRAAFDELFLRLQGPVGNYLFRLCGNRTLAEDLVQETFLRAWKAAPGWEPAAKVSTWVFRIAHNLALNEGARRRERTGPLPERAAEVPEPDEALVRALAELPEGERAVILLAEAQGFRYAEIAEVLGLPVGTVKSRMFSAVRRLRERLGG